jgi:hypothetical protein
VKAIAAGDYHAMAIMLDGTTNDWGYNYYGELGIGSNTRSTECDCIPSPQTLFTGGVVQAADGNYYDSMFLLTDGTLRGAGSNEYGELGDGSTEERTGLVTPSLTGASAVALRYYGGSAIVGPSQTLNVAFAGAGTGTVQGGGEVDCPTICSARYPQGRVVPLAATSTNGGFAGFSGPCTGTGICQTKLETDQTLTATFGPPKGTKITEAKIKKGKGKQGTKASFSFTAPGAITGYECALTRPAAKHKKRKHGKASKAAGKGSRPKFSACSTPKLFKGLKAAGRYSFRVRALDILGADAKPAVKKFTVRKPKPKKSKRRH